MCDTLVTLTPDGTLFAKNSDRDPNESQVLRWYPSAVHEEGDSVRCTWTEIPQVPSTHAVLLSQPWWMWGAEMGANEHGVVVGNEAVFTRRRGGATGTLLGMDLVRLALERANTAEDAVSVVVGLLERHGQGGSCSHEHPRFSYDNSFLVADPQEAFVLETAGRRWAVEQVTGRGRSISNGLTIPAFARAHADPLRGAVARCHTRRARTEAAAAMADTTLDLFRTLRDHGSGPAPRWSPVNGALGAPCAHAGGALTSTQTTASWVADLRVEGGLHWVTGTAAPCTSLFKPVRVTEPLDVDPDIRPDHRYDAAYRWWRHEELHRLVLRDPASSLARFTHERDEIERRWVADPPRGRGAFEQADALEDGWRRDLADAALPDRRPRWLRALWERLDGAAALDRVPA